MPPHRTEPLTEGSLLAALDLGSNSFHLIITRVEHGEIKPMHTLAEKVQLGAGLVDSRLTPEAIERGLACLARFGQLLDSVEPSRVRVVGTNALRQAKNRREFTEPAQKLLGVPVDVVYGREEARLVYLGVAHSLSDDEQSRLVVDIGGGSTEFIIGQRFEPVRLESLQMGCVSYAQRCFPEGVLSKRNFNAAYDQASMEVARIKRHFKSDHWSEAVGSSGTLQAIETLIKMAGWRESGIDRKSLDKLRKRLIKFEHIANIDLSGLSDQRRNVITAGVAITQAVFDVLNIEVMRTSKGALREGVIYDLMGRLTHEDVRERSIHAMVSRYGADATNAAIVGSRIELLAQAVADAWQFTAADIELMRWAGHCHEIGVTIAQKHFNRHSAYLLQNSDLPGFSQGEQEILAILVRCQRGKMRPELLRDIPESEHQKISRMIVLLRLAVIFKYVESLEELPDFAVTADGSSLKLSLSDEWCKAHPLTTWEINASTPVLAKLGTEISIG